MDTLFTVNTEHLGRLGPEEAVNFFRELIWAEATALGIGKNLINVPTAITVADGGIDAEVGDADVVGGQGIIKQGLTRYQIKSGDFSPSSDTDVKSILFRTGSMELKPKVKSCLDRDGTLIIVLFGWDNPEQEDEQHIGKFKARLVGIGTGYGAAKIELWPQNKLIGFLKPYPSLALQVSNRGRARFQTHKSWSQDAEMKRAFVKGEKQHSRVRDIQDKLRADGTSMEAIHVRIYGDPGIGKTRLVLEATREDDLQPQVVYCQSAVQFKDSDLMNELLREDNQFHVILVIDECNKDDRAYIWDKLKYRGSRVRIVSIHSEYDDTTGKISYLDTPPLEDEQVSGIIQGYGVPKEQAGRWAELCSGSPRVAHVIGWNLMNNPEDLLKPPDTVNIWDRYIVGGDDPNSQQVQQRRTVPRYLALFKRFGFESSVVAEAQAIMNLIGQADRQITRERFQEVIRNLRDRRILQGENTLYISPKALHIYLWIDWWNTYGTGFNFDEFSRDLPELLREWFYEMFKYAAASQAALCVVQNLLGEGGPFRNDAYLKTKLGANFFLALAEADPQAALGSLQRTVGTWSKGTLLEFTTGRREAIWALERIAMHRQLFPDAARLLLALGEAENETWSNNAGGVFAALFSPAPGRIAPTQASPQERFPILKEAIESPSKERRLLALNACNAALQSGHFMRMTGAEYQGLRELEPWTPQTWGEIFDAYRRVWLLLKEKIDNLEEDEQQEAIHVLLSHVRGLGAYHDLFDVVIDTIAELSQKPYVKKETVIATVVQILHYERERLPQEKLLRWEKLIDEIIGSDYSSLVRRYVGMDLLEDHFDDKGNHIDQSQPRIEELAQQAIDNVKLLKSNIGWLVTTDAQNCARFGHELGSRDKSFSLLSSLVAAQQEAGKSTDITFLGGYFRALFERDQQEWEKQLDRLMADLELSKLVPELTWRSGLTDKSVLRMLELTRKGVTDKSHFQMLQGNIGALSVSTFTNIAEFLLDCNDARAISILLRLYENYYVRGESKHPLPEQITMKVLTHSPLFRKNEPSRRESMDEFHWSLVAKKFIGSYPRRSLELAENMLEHFEEEDSIVTRYSSYVIDILDEITSKQPQEVWGLIIKFIGPPIDTRAWHITQWLRGHDLFRNTEGSLSMIPLGKIWEWVDEDVEKRARYLASFVPNIFVREEGKTCLARELLCRYGDREDVRHSLMGNFSTEGWSGPASLHYQNKKQQLLDFRKDEDNHDVKRWIDEYVASLDRQIERENIDEEREDT